MKSCEATKIHEKHKTECAQQCELQQVGSRGKALVGDKGEALTYLWVKESG